MNAMLIIKIVFGSLLTIGAAVLFLITFKFWYKYMIQEKRCIGETYGTIKKYTMACKGPEDSAVHLPVVSYMVDGKEYKIVGPEYKMIKLINKSTISGDNSMNYQEKNQSLIINRHSNAFVGVYRNPIEEMYPRNSSIKVFYDPARPKLAYVKRYCNKKFVFWIGFCGELFCLLTDVLILALL